MVRLARNNGLYKAVDKLWKLGVNVAESCGQPSRLFGHKKSRPNERLFDKSKKLRLFRRTRSQ